MNWNIWSVPPVVSSTGETVGRDSCASQSLLHRLSEVCCPHRRLTSGPFRCNEPPEERCTACEINARDRAEHAGGQGDADLDYSQDCTEHARYRHGG